MTDPVNINQVTKLNLGLQETDEVFITRGGAGPYRVPASSFPWQQKGDPGVPGGSWAPVLSLVTDGVRRVHRIVGWVGGTGVEPTTTGYIGAAGIVSNVAEAVDVRGLQGNAGWAPVLALVADGDRRVHQVIDWTGGAGAKPGVGWYVGATGLVELIQDAVNVRGATGGVGWSPVLAVVPDGSRRVQQIVDWIGGAGTKPTALGYVGATGIVATAALAADVRGAQGNAGWAPVLAIVADGERRVQQVVGWVGGAGTQPETLGYVGVAGIVATAAAAVDTRGPQGVAGWAPVLAIVADGERRVQQVVDWTGGAGNKPATLGYVGAAGIVATAAAAVDVRGSGAVTSSGMLLALTTATAVELAGIGSLVSGDLKNTVRSTLSLRQSAVSQAAAAYAHAVAARVDQPAWTDLTGWVTQAVPGVQVSAGRLYSTGVGASNSAAQRGIVIPATGSLRAVVRANLKAVTTDRLGIMINTQAAGAAPSAGMGSCVGLYAAGGAINSWAGSAGPLLANYSPGDYTFTITVSDVSIFVTFRKDNGTLEGGAVFPRASNAPNNVQIFCSDAAGLAGVSVGAVSYAISPTSQMPSTAVDALVDTSHVFSTVDATVNYRVWLPMGYDGRKIVPLVLMFHGNGTTAGDWVINGNMSALRSAVTARGWIAVGVDLAANRSTWGAPQGTAAYKTAYDAIRKTIPLGPLIVYANSMGGIESLNAIRLGDIPVPAAWIASAPTYSLSSGYNWPTNNFASIIRGAYGIASDGSDYATKTAGRDPAISGTEQYVGMPMMAIVPTDDVAIDPNANGAALFDRFRVTSIDCRVTNVTGGHSASVSPYTTALLDFAGAYAGV